MTLAYDIKTLLDNNCIIIQLFPFFFIYGGWKLILNFNYLQLAKDKRVHTAKIVR